MKNLKIIFISISLLNMLLIAKDENTVKVESGTKQAISYILKVQFPQNIENVPPICGYYKGYRIEFDKNISVINENNFNSQFILVITPEVNHKIEGLNLKYLERVESKNCRLFYITQNSDEKNKNSNKWIIEEEQKENLPIRLPEQSIVLLMDPNHVDCIKNKKEQTARIGSTPIAVSNDEKNNLKKDSVINLPVIMIKPNITEEEINASSIYGILAALDPNAFHPALKKASKQEREIVVSMQLLQR